MQLTKDGCKRLRLTKEIDIDKALFELLRQKVLQGSFWTTLIEKLKQLVAADDNGIHTKYIMVTEVESRHSIRQKQQGEKQDADFNAAEAWTAFVMPKLLEAFKPADIFNADETGLYL